MLPHLVHSLGYLRFADRVGLSLVGGDVADLLLDRGEVGLEVLQLFALLLEFGRGDGLDFLADSIAVGLLILKLLQPILYVYFKFGVNIRLLR